MEKKKKKKTPKKLCAMSDDYNTKCDLMCIVQYSPDSTTKLIGNRACIPQKQKCYSQAKKVFFNTPKMQPPENASTHLCNLCCFLYVCVCVVFTSKLTSSQHNECVFSIVFLFFFPRSYLFNGCNNHRRDDSNEPLLLSLPSPDKENCPAGPRRLVRAAAFRRRVPTGCASSRCSSSGVSVRGRLPRL